jgi:hypothetical protein
MGIVKSSSNEADCDIKCKCVDACYLRKVQENLIIAAFSMSALAAFIYLFFGYKVKHFTLVEGFAFWGFLALVCAAIVMICYKFYTNYLTLKKKL